MANARHLGVCSPIGMQPGARIAGKYRVLRALGEGAMGSVWAAENERTQRTFALKLIHRSHAMAEELAQRMLREARACGRLRHKHVVELYDVGETDEGQPFLVMELLDGETLESLLRHKGRLPCQQVAAIGFQVASALSAAHDAGIIHRDLKPANIFLHEHPEHGTVVKVVDFGVSKLMPERGRGATTTTTTGVAVGSPAYMSPEQATGRVGVDPRTDLWAAGVVLFEAASGLPAFDGSTAFEVVGNILHGPLPDLCRATPDADPRLGAIIARCLTRDPARRMPSARQLAAELEALLSTSAATVLRDLDDEPTLASARGRKQLQSVDPVWTPRPPSRAPSPAPVRRTPGLALALALALSAVAVVLAIAIGLSGLVHARHDEPGAPSASDPSVTRPPTAIVIAPEPAHSAEPPARAIASEAAAPAVPSVTSRARRSARRPLSPRCPADKLIFDVDGKKRCALTGHRVE